MANETNNYESGDVQIKNLTITSWSNMQPFGIIPQTVQVSIYEDLLAPCIYCEIILNDGIDLLKTLPIIGQEYVDIEFQTPGRDSYKARFVTFTPQNQIVNDNSTKSVYTLRCISEEYLYNISNNVEKGYNTTIDLIVKDIIQNKLKSKKKYFWETPRGSQQIAFTMQRPFNAIEMVKKRACSSQYKSSSFVFFENKHGFNFITVEKLMKDNGKSIGDKVFVKYTATAQNLQSPLAFRQIMQLKRNQFNIIDALSGGALYNTITTYDLIKKTLITKQYQGSQFPQFTASDANPKTPFGAQLISNFGSEPSVQMFNVTDSSKPDTYINDFLANKLGFLSTQLPGSLDIYVNGDSTMTTGDVITIQMPQPSAQSPIDPNDLLTDGNYLVAKMCHQIEVSAVKPKYTMSLNLIRGNYTQ